jgi:hypothetical protein
MLETSAGEEGRAGRKGVEREASLVAAHVRFPSLVASGPEFGLLGLGYSWLGLGKEIGESRMRFWWSWVGPRGGAPACVKREVARPPYAWEGLFLERKRREEGNGIWCMVVVLTKSPMCKSRIATRFCKVVNIQIKGRDGES